MQVEKVKKIEKFQMLSIPAGLSGYANETF